MDQKPGYVAPPPKVAFKPSRKMMMIGAGLLIAIITSIGFMLASSGNSTGKQIQHLVIRLNNLQTFISDTDTTRNIKNEELNNIIASLNLTITSDIQSLTTTLASNYPAKIDENITLSESDTATKDKIEEAYLENKLDQVYLDILDKKIASIRALMAEIYGLTKNQKLKDQLVEIDDHLREADKQLEKLSI